MHAAMVELAEKQQLKYALRPVLAQGCASKGISLEASHCLQLGTGEQLPLPGYGVELAIKNMEYKAMDDSSLKSKGPGKASTLALEIVIAHDTKCILLVVQDDLIIIHT
jgi:hypothetical protein